MEMLPAIYFPTHSAAFLRSKALIRMIIHPERSRNFAMSCTRTPGTKTPGRCGLCVDECFLMGKNVVFLLQMSQCNLCLHLFNGTNWVSLQVS